MPCGDSWVTGDGQADVGLVGGQIGDGQADMPLVGIVG